MEAKKLTASSGWLWIKQGNYLFKKNPVLSVVLTFIAVSGLLALSSIPKVGEPLVALLFPVIFSGLLWGCRALEHDEELELAHLFSGFQHHTQHLITLGGINLLGQYLIFGVMKLTGGAALVSVLLSDSAVDDPAIIEQAMTGASLAILLGIALFSVLLMATQFAPMLVTFDKASPIQALRASLRGCLQNLTPLSVYGAMMILFAFVASLPMMLGWLILLPIMITSIYAAYRGIFPTAAERVGVETVTSPTSPQEPSQND